MCHGTLFTPRYNHKVSQTEKDQHQWLICKPCGNELRDNPKMTVAVFDCIIIIDRMAFSFLLVILKNVFGIEKRYEGCRSRWNDDDGCFRL